MRISKYDWVFLTRSGIGLKGFRLIEETIHQYKGKRIGFLKYALLQFFLRKKVTLTGNYFVVHNHWCPGYYHWITEALPRLLIGSQSLSEYTLIIPESFKKTLHGSIFPLYKGQIYWIDQKTNLIVEHLAIPENPPFSGHYNSKIFRQLRQIYLDELQRQNLVTSASTKVYVSRSKAAKRKVYNESELVTWLSSEGFNIINFEDLTFWQQVALMNNTALLVSIHGAGLSNMLFLKPGSIVVELQKKAVRIDEQQDTLYQDFAEILNLQYMVQFCKPVQQNMSHYDADIIVDLKALKNLLSFM